MILQTPNRTDLKMQKGKMCAQCGHAALGVYRKAVSEKRNLELKSWLSGGQAKIALQCKGEAEMLLLKEAADKAGVLNYCVADAGRTQVPGGTRTVLAIGPAPVSVIDPITRSLKLL
eukprot:TRINITY_DN1268_c0_g1_i1.p1 TRINITY_DN1268_c0_g1~~TRINITY_DN1268_c0_g1_i1.p1  ORF type:complete len:117 (+),score=24.11 TRINITY_DN1268_c0_g1_i1:328-678(+)